MPVQTQSALISGLFTLLVAVITGVITGVVTLKISRNQRETEKVHFQQDQAYKQKEFQQELERFQHERREWLTELRKAYEVELYKTRIESYPKIFQTFAKLSHHAPERVTAENATQIAHELNDWFYSVGGMCAEADTRGAIRGLRNLCDEWGKQKGKKPSDFNQWRNAAMLLLRRDLNIRGLERFDTLDSPMPILERLEKENDQSNTSFEETLQKEGAAIGYGG
jgi:hypothetical protein